MEGEGRKTTAAAVVLSSYFSSGHLFFSSLLFTACFSTLSSQFNSRALLDDFLCKINLQITNQNRTITGSGCDSIAKFCFSHTAQDNTGKVLLPAAQSQWYLRCLFQLDSERTLSIMFLFLLEKGKRQAHHSLASPHPRTIIQFPRVNVIKRKSEAAPGFCCTALRREIKGG